MSAGRSQWRLAPSQRARDSSGTAIRTGTAADSDGLTWRDGTTRFEEYGRRLKDAASDVQRLGWSPLQSCGRRRTGCTCFVPAPGLSVVSGRLSPSSSRNHSRTRRWWQTDSRRLQILFLQALNRTRFVVPPYPPSSSLSARQKSTGSPRVPSSRSATHSGWRLPRSRSREARNPDRQRTGRHVSPCRENAALVAFFVPRSGAPRTASGARPKLLLDRLPVCYYSAGEGGVR